MDCSSDEESFCHEKPKKKSKNTADDVLPVSLNDSSEIYGKIEASHAKPKSKKQELGAKVIQDMHKSRQSEYNKLVTLGLFFHTIILIASWLMIRQLPWFVYLALLCSSGAYWIGFVFAYSKRQSAIYHYISWNRCVFKLAFGFFLCFICLHFYQFLSWIKAPLALVLISFYFQKWDGYLSEYEDFLLRNGDILMQSVPFY